VVKRRLLVLSLAVLAAGCNTGLGLGQGRLYACDRDGGWLGDGGGEPQCPGDFHCGLEGYCHARDGGTAWRCEADFDCDQGWRCGLRGDGGVGACQNRAAGGPYPCLPGDDSKCEQGWRCGLSGLCHDPDAGGALPCLDGEDSWCDRGWRCGPELVCVDPSHEALLPTPERDAGAERLAPRFTDGAAAASVYAGPATLSAGWVRGAEVAAASWAGTGGPLWTPPAVVSVGVDAGALVQAFATGIYVAEGARVRRVPFGVDGGTAVALAPELLPGFPGFVPTGLRSFELPPGPVRRLLAAFDPQRLAVFADDGGSPPPPPAGGFPLPVPDAGLVDLQLCEAGLIAATSSGLFFSPAAPVGWIPVLPPSPPPLALRRVRYAQRGAGGLLALLTDAPDGGRPMVGAAPTATLPAGPGAFALQALRQPDLCEACPGGAQVVELLAIDTAAGGARVVVRCSRGGQQFLAEHQVVNDMLVCAAGLRPTPPAADEPGGPAMIAPNGVTSLRAGGFDDFVTLGSAPWAFLESDAGTVCFAPQQDHGGLYLLDPTLGFTALRFTPPAALTSATAVEGTPDLAAVLTTTDLRIVSANAQWAVVDVSADLLDGPLRATSRRDDGGTSFYVSDFDTLLAGQLADGDDAGTLSTRAVPLPRQAIQSITALPPTSRGDGGVYQYLGYVAAQGRVFRFLAFTDQVWRTDELLMSGEAVAVWADTERARAGLRDGTVVSLPSRVVIGAALPGGLQVQQYAHLCGETFALSSAGLHRLVLRPDGGVIGAWVEEHRLDQALGGPPIAAGVTLFTTPTDLVATTRDHVVARLRLDCR